MIPRQGLLLQGPGTLHVAPSSLSAPPIRRSRSSRLQAQHSSSDQHKQQRVCQAAQSSQQSSIRRQGTVCAALGNGNSANMSSMAACSPMLMLPMGVLTDSYKASHFLQYPQAKKMVAVSFCTQFLIGYAMSSSAVGNRKHTCQQSDPRDGGQQQLLLLSLYRPACSCCAPQA